MSEAIHLEGMRRQLAHFAARRSAGMARAGWKIGINVPEVQRRAGLAGALVGYLDGERVFASGAIVPMPQGARLHVEPELCLELHARVPRGASVEEARAAIRHVHPALELVDYSLPRTDLTTTIAHSMFHHGIVLGPPLPVPSESAVDAFVRELVLEVGATRSAPARADLIPRDLAALVLRAAQVLGELDEGLEAGDLLMSGSFTEAALPLAAGERAAATFAPGVEVYCRAGADRS